MVFSSFCHMSFAENASFKVLASFANHHCILHFLPRCLASCRWTEEAAIASFQLEECVQLATAPTTQLTHR